MAERNSAFDAEFGIRGDFIIAGRAMHPLLLARNEESSDRFYSNSDSFRYQADAAEVAEFKRRLRIAEGVGGRVAISC